MPEYLADPGGQFKTDTHRRVVANLSYPNDDFGWKPEALFHRMIPDVGTKIESIAEVEALLAELEADGYADQPAPGVYRQTQAGADLVNGPMANEPKPGEPVQGPALIVSAATPINAGTPVES